MGNSVSFYQVAQKCQRASATLAKAEREQTMAVAPEMEAVHERVVVAALHGPKFPHWKPELIAKAKPISGGLRFAPVRSALGAERVGQSGRHAGMSGPIQGPPGLTKTGKVSRKKRKRWNGTTQGKGTWTATVEQFGTIVPPKLRSGYSELIGEIFR